MTEKELRTQYGDIFAQIEQEASEAARTSAIAEERARIQAIEEIEATIDDKQLIYDAKYGAHPMTAAQLAAEVMKRQAAARTSKAGQSE